MLTFISFDRILGDRRLKGLGRCFIFLFNEGPVSIVYFLIFSLLSIVWICFPAKISSFIFIASFLFYWDMLKNITHWCTHAKVIFLNYHKYVKGKLQKLTTSNTLFQPIWIGNTLLSEVWVVPIELHSAFYSNLIFASALTFLMAFTNKIWRRGTDWRESISIFSFQGQFSMI